MREAREPSRRHLRTSRHLAPLVLVFLVLSVPAIAWNEPDTFRGIPWGAPEDTVRSQIPAATCTATKSALFGEMICSSSFTVGDVSTKALLWFRSGGFVGVTFSFDPRRFVTIESAFKERYGPPTNTREEHGKTRAGVEFVNVEHEWQGEKVYISLRKYAGKITESRARILTAAEWEEQKKYVQQSGKKGADDL